LLYSFGRTVGIKTSEKFTIALSQKLNVECIKFNWFSKDGFSGLEEKIDLIRQSKYLITDIYHLALIGLREDIPTICIGRGAPYNKGTLYDKKKEFFFQQFQAQQYYVFFEYLELCMVNSEELNTLIAVCSRNLNNYPSLNRIYHLINSKRADAEKLLISAIESHEAII
jgi:polysaccharide pyruvyl transferase WcaK-like protein